MRCSPDSSARIRARLLCIPLILAAAIAGCSGDGPVDQSAETGDIGFQVMPSRSNAALHDVWGTSSSDVFAVGDNGTILHYNGARWRPMPSPTTENLRGVSGGAADAVFASGDNGTLLRYDGSTWTPVDAGTSNDLGAIHVTGYLVVVADRDEPGVIRWLEVFPNGYNRVVEDTGAGQVINDVTTVVSGSSVAFAACDAGVARYKKGTWLSLETGSADLVSAFASTPGNAFMLDADGTLWHFRGRAEAVPVASAGGAMADAVQRTYDDVLMFGPGGRVVRYNRCQLTELRSGSDADIEAAWAAPGGDVFAVGSGGAILRFRERLERPCPDNLVLRVGDGANPTLTWMPACAVSKVIVTNLDERGDVKWFVAADGNHIESGLQLGVVPECASELRPWLVPLEIGPLYRVTLIRRDSQGDLDVAMYNFRIGEGSQTLTLAQDGPTTSSSGIEGVFVQPVAPLFAPIPGEPMVVEFRPPERLLDLEFEVEGLNSIDGVIQVLVRDPDTGLIEIRQIDDLPIAQVGDSYIIDWPYLTE